MIKMANKWIKGLKLGLLVFAYLVGLDIAINILFSLGGGIHDQLSAFYDIFNFVEVMILFTLPWTYFHQSKKAMITLTIIGLLLAIFLVKDYLLNLLANSNFMHEAWLIICNFVGLILLFVIPFSMLKIDWQSTFIKVYLVLGCLIEIIMIVSSSFADSLTILPIIILLMIIALDLWAKTSMSKFR